MTKELDEDQFVFRKRFSRGYFGIRIGATEKTEKKQGYVSGICKFE